MDASLVDRPFGCPVDIVLNLPAPPSVNRTRRSHGRGIRELDKWHKLADQFVTLAWAGGRAPKKILKQFEILIVLDEKTVGQDLDNPIKAAIDYCRRLDLIANDDKRYLRELRVVWGDAPTGCRIVLRPREAN